MMTEVDVPFADYYKVTRRSGYPSALISPRRTLPGRPGAASTRSLLYFESNFYTLTSDVVSVVINGAKNLLTSPMYLLTFEIGPLHRLFSLTPLASYLL